jgi:hypothetical protein
MRLLRRFSVLGLTLLLTVGVSCTSGDGTTNEALGPSTEQQQSPSFGLIGNLTGGLTGTVDGLTGTADGLTGTADGLNGTVDDLTGTVVGTLGNVTNLLRCSPQPYAIRRTTIGPSGGVITVGTHQLVIPKDALSENVEITAEQVTGSTNSVRFSPEGLRFDRPARLVMSYENCALVLLKKKIVFTTEKLKILEVLPSLDLFKKKVVNAPIDHFSRYAVAY